MYTQQVTSPAPAPTGPTATLQPLQVPRKDPNSMSPTPSFTQPTAANPAPGSGGLQPATLLPGSLGQGPSQPQPMPFGFKPPSPTAASSPGRYPYRGWGNPAMRRGRYRGRGPWGQRRPIQGQLVGTPLPEYRTGVYNPTGGSLYNPPQQPQYSTGSQQMNPTQAQQLNASYSGWLSGQQ